MVWLCFTHFILGLLIGIGIAVYLCYIYAKRIIGPMLRGDLLRTDQRIIRSILEHKDLL